MCVHVYIISIIKLLQGKIKPADMSLGSDWTVDDAVIRIADISDRQRVLDIHGDIYNGMDYLPAMYNEFCHGKKYIMFIAEVKGVPVRFIARDAILTYAFFI